MASGVEENSSKILTCLFPEFQVKGEPPIRLIAKPDRPRSCRLQLAEAHRGDTVCWLVFDVSNLL